MQGSGRVGEQGAVVVVVELQSARRTAAGNNRCEGATQLDSDGDGDGDSDSDNDDVAADESLAAARFVRGRGCRRAALNYYVERDRVALRHAVLRRQSCKGESKLQ